MASPFVLMLYIVGISLSLLLDGPKNGLYVVETDSTSIPVGHSITKDGRPPNPLL